MQEGAELVTKKKQVSGHPIPAATGVDAYFSKGNNPARSKFRHVLRKAATESKAMGRQTYREMNVAQKKYVIDRVISECPDLKGSERRIDQVLIKSLIQAKHYQLKKKKKMQKDDHGSVHGGKDPKTQKKKKTQKDDHRSVERGKAVDAAQDPISDEKVKNKRKKDESGHSGGKKGKSSSGHKQTPYERSRERNMETNKKIWKALSESFSLTEDERDSAAFRPGNKVNVTDGKGTVMATALFLQKRNDIYADVIMQELKGDSAKDVPLPEPANDKTMLDQLEKNDQFVWKLEKLSTSADPQLGEGTSRRLRTLRKNVQPPDHFM